MKAIIKKFRIAKDARVVCRFYCGGNVPLHEYKQAKSLITLLSIFGIKIKFPDTLETYETFDLWIQKMKLKYNLSLNN